MANTTLSLLPSASQVFNRFDPFFVGSDRLLDQFTTIGKSMQATFPPYNIVKTSDEKYCIEVALAGWKKEDIDISVKAEVLTISGSISQDDKPETPNYIHKGISTRSFKRQFVLNDSVVVKSATMENGMLFVELEHIIPDEKKPRHIDIM